MVWVGELCGYIGGYAYDTPAFADVIRLATKLDVVVQIHDDSAADIARLLAGFPGMTFVLAHLGDSPEEVEERIGLAARFPNLYLAISAWVCWSWRCSRGGAVRQRLHPSPILYSKDALDRNYRKILAPSSN